MSVTLKINQQRHTLENIDPDTPLLWVLRDELGLVGTKFGCGIAQCGACTVQVDGIATRSCQTKVGDLANKNVLTIEGLAENADNLHPLQQAWLDLDVPQCGYCQAGQLMSAAALLEQHPQPTDQQIDTYMAGNICRCGTYPRIKAAIKQAAEG